MARRPAPDSLQHYTDAAGLKGIVESGRIRATHIAYMNDASEYLHAVQLFSERIREAKKTRTDKDQLALLEIMDEPVANTKPENVAPYFVSCFSEKENSLNQWRAYGRGEGGYSIGFDTAKLGAAIAKHAAILTPALYHRDEQADLIGNLFEWALNEYPKLAANYSGDEKTVHCQSWAQHMLWFASGLAPIMKNPAFEEESEWRTIYLLRAQREIKFVPKLKGLVPVIDMKLGEPRMLAPLPTKLPNDTLDSQSDKLPITSLWSGPGSSSQISLLAGRAILEKHEYVGVQLMSSEIPFRVS